jgi:hypothetical protein
MQKCVTDSKPTTPRYCFFSNEWQWKASQGFTSRETLTNCYGHDSLLAAVFLFDVFQGLPAKHIVASFEYG